MVQWLNALRMILLAWAWSSPRLLEMRPAGFEPVEDAHDSAQCLKTVGVGTHKAVRIEPVCQLAQQCPSATP